MYKIPTAIRLSEKLGFSLSEIKGWKKTARTGLIFHKKSALFPTTASG
jgi:hypothetical protein